MLENLHWNRWVILNPCVPQFKQFGKNVKQNLFHLSGSNWGQISLSQMIAKKTKDPSRLNWGCKLADAGHQQALRVFPSICFCEAIEQCHLFGGNVTQIRGWSSASNMDECPIQSKLLKSMFRKGWSTSTSTVLALIAPSMEAGRQG